MFLVCGEALFDFFLEREVGPAAATYDARAGGSPFNVAIGLARLGQASGLLTGLSSDLLGQRLAQVLADVAAGTASVLEHGYLEKVEGAHGLPAAARQQPGRIAGADLAQVDPGMQASGELPDQGAEVDPVRGG